ncbi:MAG TPA: zf-HC2 domain-containing protein [Candidatus Dormibacteraeota bacterium]|nr:zf-HC2 domain-containing protein [Candidatus Dormibacteraeota bacterium]
MSCKEVNCKTLLNELCDFLDGGLDADTVQEIKLHLDRCEDCRVLVDTTQKTIEIFCNTEPIPLPEGVRERLHQALEQRLRNPRA